MLTLTVIDDRTDIIVEEINVPQGHGIAEYSRALAKYPFGFTIVRERMQLRWPVDFTAAHNPY